MLLVDSLSEIHPDKLPAAIQSYIRDGRGPEVRQAIPLLTQRHPEMRDLFSAVLRSLERTEQPLDLISGANGVAITCANCGGSVSKQSANTQIVICLYCGNNAELPNADGLSRWQGRIDTQAKFSIGSYFKFRGEKWQAIGVQKYSGTIREWDKEDRTWENNSSRFTLWWMLNEKRELAWLSDYGSKRYWSTKYLPKKPEIPKDKDRKIEYGSWFLTFAAGEFSYEPQPGEKRRSWEFNKAPGGEAVKDTKGDRYSYSTEASLDENGKPSEIEFFRSIPLSNQSILQSLGSNELLANVSRWRLSGMLLAAAGVLSILVGFVLKVAIDSDNLLSTNTTFASASTESVELGELRVEDTPTILRFSNQLRQGLPANRWAEFELELEDGDSNPVGGYYVEFWHETGYDDGPWRESVYRVNRDIRIEEPGTYKLRGLMDQTNANFPFKVQLDVTTNPVSTKPFFFAMFAGIVAAILSMVRAKSLATGGASLGGKIAESTSRRKRKKPGNKNKRKDKKKSSDKNSGNSNKSRNNK